MTDDKLSDSAARRARRALSLPEFATIKPGQAGFELLLKAEKAQALDVALKAGHVADTPCGPMLKDKVADAPHEMRPAKHTNSVARCYADALKELRGVFDAAADAETVGGDAIRRIAEHFVEMYLKDSNVLLAVAHTKAPAGDFVYHHSLNVCLFAICIAASCGYSREQVVEIGIAALLHDIGMLLVPKEIVDKKGGLTQDEWFEIQKHPIFGLLLLERIPSIPESALYAVYQTHERENGKGYPRQHTAKLIHRCARIVQVADIYEALSSPRPYRDAHMPYKAMEMVVRMTRQGLVSGELVKSFLTCTSLFPVGSLVELSDGRKAKVVQANGSSFAKPAVRVLTDTRGNRVDEMLRVREDLSSNTQVQITRALAFDAMPDVTVLEGF